MKKEVRCKKCKYVIPVKSVAEDRAKLARELGKEFTLTCPECHTISTYHVNDVKAKKSFFTSMLVIAIMWIATFVIAYLFYKYFDDSLYYYGLLVFIGIPSVILSIYSKAETKQISYFNRYKK